MEKGRLAKFSLSRALIGVMLSLGASTGVHADDTNFALTSPDLASGVFDNKFVLNGFGLQWRKCGLRPSSGKTFLLGQSR